MSTDRLGLRVGAVVLAAGASRRMGRSKALLVLGGETLVRRAVRRAREAGFAPVVVVVGPDAQRERSEVADLGVDVVVNPDPSTPSSVSFQLGVRSLGERVEAAAVILVDMPRVEAAHLAALRRAWVGGAGGAAAARYGGVVAPPIVIPRAWFSELFAWAGEGAGRGLVARHASETTFADLPPEALLDVDTPGEWESISRPTSRD